MAKNTGNLSLNNYRHHISGFWKIKCRQNLVSKIVLNIFFFLGGGTSIVDAHLFQEERVARKNKVFCFLKRVFQTSDVYVLLYSVH
jgi:hypothetical protein